MSRLTDEQIEWYREEAIQHGGLNAGSVLWLLDEVKALRRECDNAHDALAELLDYTDRHRMGYEAHDHDCFEEWCLLRDEARRCLRHCLA